MSRRPYIRELPRTTWWLAQPRYIRYMLREISALFIGIYVLVLIVGLLQLSAGRAAYEEFLASTAGPAGRNTWFQVTPKAMPLTLAGKRVPGAFIIAAHWFGFFLASAAMWLLAGS